MPTMTTAKRAPAKQRGTHSIPAPKLVVKDHEPRILHRVGSLVNDSALGEPKTVGQRMAARRLELKMTQDDVAKRVVFQPKTGSRRNDEVVLSRNAYCMYETGGVEPDLPKIEGIAKVLEVTPQWLAFGVEERKTVASFKFNVAKKTFVPSETWVLPEDWLARNLGVQASDIELFIPHETKKGQFESGDAIIVQRKAEVPGGSFGKFLFVYSGKVRVAELTRPHRSENLKVSMPGSKKPQEIPSHRVQIWGRVIGKIASLERQS